MSEQPVSVFLMLGLSVAAFAVACSPAPPPWQEQVATEKQVPATTAQTLLAGNTIPQFVDALPTLQSARVNGTATVNVDMEEFQQHVLPPQFYPSAGQFSKGTYLWGYNVNGEGPSWPSRPPIHVIRAGRTPSRCSRAR